MAQFLLHIGFAKAGSTYLQQWFEKHPSMYFQPKDVAGGFYHAWELAKYIQHSDKVPQNFVLSCEDFSVWKSEPYIYGVRGTQPYDYRKFQDMMCETLHGLYPTAKVLIVTRGYTTIFKSVYSQYLSMAGTLTFEEMLRETRDMFSVLLDYTYVVNLYREKFGTANVILLPFELLQKDPEKFLSLIEQQMKIEETFEFHPNKVNAAYPPKVLRVYFKLSKLVYNLLKPFPHSWQNLLYLRYIKIARNRKTLSLMVFVSKFVKDETINWDGMDDMIASFKGKADVLRREELYQPFLKEYLL